MFHPLRRRDPGVLPWGKPRDYIVHRICEGSLCVQLLPTLSDVFRTDLVDFRSIYHPSNLHCDNRGAQTRGAAG